MAESLILPAVAAASTRVASGGSRMAGIMAEDQGSVKSEDSLTGRAKFLCSYGGRIMPRPHDSQLRYVGGETRILSVHRGITFLELMTKLKRLCNNENVSLKYQLPNEDLDALVSVLSEEDLENMMEEYDRIESKDSSSRLRLFLFPSVKKVEAHDHTMVVDTEHKFMEAVNSLMRKPEVAPAMVTPLVTPVATLGNLTTPAVLAPQQAHFPVAHVAGATSTLAPHLSLVPPAVASPLVPAPATPLVPPPVAAPVLQHSPLGPQVLTSPSNVPNVVAVPLPPKVLATAGAAVTPAAPLVRVAPPAAAVPPVAAVPVVQVIQRPPPPQAAPSKSGYVPLVEVSRGMLPKGMVLRQYSLEDDHPDSASSQGSGHVAVHGSPELLYLDRRDSDELLERKAAVVDVHPVLPGGGQAKVAAESHLERYLKEQTMETPQAAQPTLHYLISESAQRVGSAPQLPHVDVMHGKHMNRQFSDHQESPTGMRSGGVQVSCATHMHIPAATGSDSIIPMDAKHQVNGVIRQPHQLPVVHSEHKVVPQFVHPYQN